MASPPPLPPRASGATDHAPHAGSTSPDHLELLHGDPRSSSTQSLVPSLTEPHARRTLLVVYIHGFYGNDQSFRSFPAHVHALLRTLLADSHMIHSKIYPRYKTYKAIEVARDNFSAWLEPHESPTTDVILVGHSMGGLLTGEVVLMPNKSPYHQQAFKHKIIGTLSLDSPFLGLHPGIVVSGISSLFQPAAKSSDEAHDGAPSSPPSIPASPAPTPSMDSHLDSAASSFTSSSMRRNDDPHYDPPYWNDEPFRERPFFKRIANFASKHKSEGIFHAVRNHVVSHLEFGGCLADYRSLITRYNRLRALENVDEVQAISDGHPSAAYARVRFANYYTLSSGRPKVPKAPSPGASCSDDLDPGSPSLLGEAAPGSEMDSPEVSKEPHQTISLLDIEVDSRRASGSSISTPRISIEAPADEEPESPSSRGQNQSSSLDGGVLDDVPPPRELARISMLSMQDVDPIPMADDPDLEPRSDPEPRLETEPDQLVLPPIPEEPQQPTLPDLVALTDKDARKQAEKEAKRMQKNYAQAVKDRAKAIRERDKLLEKRRKRAQKDADKMEKKAQKEQMRLDKEEKKKLEEAKQAVEGHAGNPVVGTYVDDTAMARGVIDEPAAAVDGGDKPKKLRKFCNLPGKTNGVPDTTWVDVYMDGMDEVGAHCGLFAPGPHYEKLVGDVGSRIVGWIHDDMTKRAILEAQ
ncbi:hypothetical protein JDV02_005121 [Purpureocillium takamizusanense]|uniref:DUF676 domain-containing protein n=1 Tax=Purpureocillium takamizusanense TaxID=2060973 RepID=A0A9Q8QFX6_9HYPO|nr:uncharacterized protein JDV02_005121 [Purpureocillium takamizusanense]UNI18883.1 hypothetical protein JDV02_005121 [Purpureocillium takamizusanense]